MSMKPMSFTTLQGGASHRHLMKPAKLNLVSLMDIFTILVFFLLLNSGSNEILKVNDVTLPDSTAQEQPKETITVLITDEHILVDGRPVADMVDVVNGNGLIDGLTEELTFLASKREELTEEEKALGRSATILGDQAIPYEILKRVMLTCAKSNYRDISLAVSRISSGSSGA
ncbi:ExbD/TolR family protein [Marinobacter zhejiangensis]|uniref:Biopolymer transport protein ExbD n=1 Tax=Marinobacter zhejiangensis TaxID=488535 RepID=A0A1I4KXE8_9GAMM|nr:biopolymer transporter ExbD [Marinobacter zhejiangensis]SFL83273.1 Biopolymer transport protein ExbD [Marinobacter zhejiangensis]